MRSYYYKLITAFFIVSTAVIFAMGIIFITTPQAKLDKFIKIREKMCLKT